MLHRPIQLDSYKSQEPHKLHYSGNLEGKLLEEKNGKENRIYKTDIKESWQNEIFRMIQIKMAKYILFQVRCSTSITPNASPRPGKQKKIFFFNLKKGKRKYTYTKYLSLNVNICTL